MYTGGSHPLMAVFVVGKGVLKKKKFSSRFFMLLGVFVIAVAALVYISQERKLQDIQREQERLAERYQELLNEQQRIEYMIEYAQSEEYLLQYAREKLGYVYEDEIKFNITE